MSNHLFSALLPDGRDRDSVCLRHPGGATTSYGEVEAESARFAHILQMLGVASGDRVLVQVEKSPAALFLYLACIRSGAIFLPLNSAYTLREVGYFIADAEPKLIVCRPTDASALRTMAAARVETLGADGTGSLSAQAKGASAACSDVACGPDDTAVILYTSGTTGRSKGAMLTHGNLRSNAEVLARTWRFSPSDVLIHALPIFHAHGLFVAVNVSFVAGSEIIFLPRFDAEEALALMPHATVMMGVPTFYTRLLQTAGLTRERTATMRLFVSGSAPLLPDTFNAFRERTGHTILERYGMTETSMNTSNPYDGPRIAGSVGLPLDGVTVRIADPASGRLLGVGEVGMIELKGPNVFSGYWRMPKKTRAEFRPDGFFITGDLGRIDADGYVWIVGRGKDLIISGGYNVYPKEVELEIDALPGVAESAVIGVPHADFGEAVTAIVVRDGSEETSEATIIERLRGSLAGYKLPKRVLFVDELPRNTMAKVQKNVLRDRYASLFA